MFRKIIVALGILLLTGLPVSASHYMGGEIIWECLPNGNFRFILKVYRECGGIQYPTTGISMTSNSPAGTIQMRLWPNAVQGIKDISPQCNGDPMFSHIKIKCLNTSPPQPSNQGAVEEWTYTTDQMYPNGVTLNGVPPPSGWVFAYTNCCRNPCTNINAASTKSWYVRAIMYPYNNTNTYPCWDDSPTFYEKPSTVVCTGYPFTYNHNAYDKQLDSLTYEWDTPLETGLNSPITGWNAGYSYTSPLPGTFHNPQNVNATVNPYTGEISFTSYTQGAFITVTKVTAYKCGIKIAEVFREMQIVLLACDSNDPPDVTAPFFDTTTMTWSKYIDTVYAGAVVNFYFTALDTTPLILANGQLTSVTLTATGSQFGLGYSSTVTGCLNPPCAILNPPPPISQVMGLNTQFTWQTTCAHLETQTGCGGTSNVYNFILKAQDDFCPAPGINVSTITVVVRNAILGPPSLRCISVEPNGNVILDWEGPDTTKIPNTLESYHIYTAINPNGPFVLLDSVFGYNNTTYTHVGANAANVPRYYFLRSRSGCYGNYYSGNSDTLRTINLNVTNIGSATAELTWNQSHTPPLPTSLGLWEIYREQGPGNWINVGNTTSLTYQDVVPAACGFVRYRVMVTDSSGCESWSSVGEDMFRSAVPPHLRCVSTSLDGQVTITWVLPDDPITEDNFSSYQIFHSLNPNGPFLLLDSVTTFTTVSYTHAQANGNATINYYVVQTKIDCDGYFSSADSDTINNTVLIHTAPTTQSGDLSWNHNHTPLLPSATGVYMVYREFPPGTWILLDSTENLAYSHEVLVCNDTVNYRVEMADSSGCVSVSSQAGDFYFDDDFPDIPVLDSVSIDTNFWMPVLGWQPSVAGDVHGYIIFRNDGIWVAIDTVWGQNETFYMDEDPAHNPCDAPQYYCIAAFDTCGRTSPMGIDNIHNSMYLEITNYNPCLDIIELEWTPYRNIKDNLLGYRIFVSENGGPFYVLATNLAQGTNPPSNKYTHKQLVKDTEYCYYIQAYSDLDVSSRSCEACIVAEKASPPNYLYIRYATVEENDHIRLQVNVDDNPATVNFKILRSASLNGPYEVIGNIPPSPILDWSFLDYDAYFKKQSYFYKVVAVDSCGVDAFVSDLARTIHLTAEPRNDFTNYLEWNDYLGWNWAGVKQYNLYRIVDGLADPIPVAVLPFGTTSFVDDVMGLTETQGKFSYHLEAVQGPGIPDFADTSLSNKAELLQRSRIFIPNAISPKGYNNQFKPITVYVDMSEYYFSIYNRWGQKIFETRDPERSWDGTYNNEFVPGGVYVYRVTFLTSTGDTFEKRGTVTVIY